MSEKKTKKGYDGNFNRNSGSSSPITKNLKINSNDILGLFISHLKEEHSFSHEKIKNIIRKEKEKVLIPVSIFNKNLSSLETIVKYLKENINLKNKEISDLLNRNARTIWTTYQNSIDKHPKKFSLVNDREDKKEKEVKEKNEFFIPVSELKDRNFSVLEIIVRYLKQSYGLTFAEIALLIKRNPNTVWTVCNRARKKEMKIKKNATKEKTEKKK